MIILSGASEAGPYASHAQRRIEYLIVAMYSRSRSALIQISEHEY